LACLIFFPASDIFATMDGQMPARSLLITAQHMPAMMDVRLPSAGSAD